MFHRKSVDEGKTVGVELAEFLKCRDDFGRIIFTTHQVLQYVPFWTKKNDIHLLIDEDFQVVRYESLRLPHTHRLITDDIRVEGDGPYGKVLAINQSFNGKARNKDDDAVLRILPKSCG